MTALSAKFISRTKIETPFIYKTYADLANEIWISKDSCFHGADTHYAIKGDTIEIDDVMIEQDTEKAIDYNCWP